MSRPLGRCQAGAEGKRTRHLGEELVAEKDRRSSFNLILHLGDMEKNRSCLHIPE